MGIPSFTDLLGGKLRSRTTRRFEPSLGTVCNGDVRRGTGNGLQVNGPAVAVCASSVNKKESMSSGKRIAEERFGSRDTGKSTEWQLIGHPKARKSTTTESG